MRDDLIKSIDFKKVTTIISKEQSDIEEWKNCILIPFRLLDGKSIYSVTYIVFIKHKSCGYANTGTPEVLYNRLLERIKDADDILIFISNSDNKKENWFISRD